MKKTVVLLAATLAFVGCQRGDQTANEPAGAEKERIEQSKDAQKDALDQEKKHVSSEAKMEKKQIGAQADAQKETVEAQSDAQKAQIDAQKKEVDAEAKAQKAQTEANKDVSEAAGAEQKDANSDKAIETRVREALVGTDQTTPTSTAAQNIKISVDKGVVTLKGTVKTEAEKMDLENKAKVVSGVQSVTNEIEVKAE